MALNNIQAIPSEGMADWVREVEAQLKSANLKIAALQSQLNARR